MFTLGKLSRALRTASRVTADANAVASGDPSRIGRRVRNKIVGRALARAGLFRWLWK